MLIRIIQIGKEKHQFVTEGIQEYLRRLTPIVEMEIITLKASQHENPNVARQEEKKVIEKYLSPQVILLDETGLEMTSKEFAKYVEKKMEIFGGEITFLIGGSYGFDETIKSLNLQKIAFSKMTFTHEMIRLILVEQIYRAFSILKNKNYHH